MGPGIDLPGKAATSLDTSNTEDTPSMGPGIDLPGKLIYEGVAEVGP